MRQPKLLVTMKDIQKFKILKDVVDKKLTGIEAAQLLNLHPVHICRLKGKLSEGGFEALLRKLPLRPPNQRIREPDIKRILRLRKEIYYDFNILHFTEKLRALHRLHYSRESIRQLLIKAGVYHPKKKRKIHRMRRRMPKAGLLVQIDSSQHKWLEHIEEPWQLVAPIDDATNKVAYAKFFPKDTLFANMQVLRRLIEIEGVFMSLYVDKASHFKTTRHGGLHVNVAQEQADTQIERALSELGINVIPANSPQAKGRIEVTFRLFQDRLIKEMRLAKIKNYHQANKFLVDEFLPWYNKRFTHQAENAYMPLAKEKNLDYIFCLKRQRTVNNDNTVQIYSQTIQIPPSETKRTFAKLKVDVCLLEDKRIFVLYQGKVIAESRLSKNNKVVKKGKQIEALLNKRNYALMLIKPKRVYRKPDRDNPWYAFRLKGSTPNRKLKFNI